MGEKILICYGTRYGTTAKISEFMANVLREQGADVELVDLKRDRPQQALDTYSLILIGSGIQMGRWTGEPLKFIKNNEAALARARVAIYVVCAFAANPEKCDFVQTEFIDKVLAKYPSLRPVATTYFAGMYDFSKYNRFIRALVRKIIKSENKFTEPIPEKIDYRDWDKIREWAVGLVAA
ncbi:MAG: nitric oxide synthase [Candidatus Thorarchaeota archaeon]|nr:nitric oxide synthase [Candidatus Thorarchaeota archaeon]